MLFQVADFRPVPVLSRVILPGFPPVVLRVYLPAFPPRVLRDQFPFHVFIELVQVDVAEGRRYHAALRTAAERLMVFPVFQVPGPEHVAHEPEEPLVMDFLRQYP